jgi:glutamyl-tRNA(Gln) amidotransferase subunit D
MNPGDRIRVETPARTVEGVLLPSSTHETLVVKLDSGYNVGIDRTDADPTVLESGVHHIDGGPDDDAASTDAAGAGDEEGSAVTFDDDLPTVALVTTGGTIASTVDYRTGAVTAQFDAEDVLRAVPDLAGRANYHGRVVATILSENMTPGVWQDLARAVHEEIEQGADGVVVMHGTDTMAYSAAALAFMLDTPVPIVFTGSQRSADRPSSDNVMNAVCAVEAATADYGEVLLCMHATRSDDRCALHRGTRARKAHTSRRDAFRTVGGAPVGHVDYGGEAVDLDTDLPDRGATDLALHDDLETDVELLRFAPGADPDRVRRLDECAGVVIAGTGLGHVSREWIDPIAELVDGGTRVVMTSSCLDGRVCDRVYDTGRDLLDAGVIEAADTLPGTAYVKLMWALANADDVATAMRRPLAGECTRRSVPAE